MVAARLRTAASCCVAVKPSIDTSSRRRALFAHQRGDANHEELVEIRADDREELDALEQRVRLVERLIEHALVELEPAQFAVDEQRGVLKVADGGWSDRLRLGHTAVIPRRAGRRGEGAALNRTAGEFTRLLRAACAPGIGFRGTRAGAEHSRFTN